MTQTNQHLGNLRFIHSFQSVVVMLPPRPPLLSPITNWSGVRICAFSKNLHQGQTVFFLAVFQASQLGQISFRDLLQDPPHLESPGALPSLPSAALTFDIWARTHTFRGVTFYFPSPQNEKKTLFA